MHVYVDNTDPARPVTPMPDVIRAAVDAAAARLTRSVTAGVTRWGSG